jgi:DNA-binding CsgD family transcriptional regulator
VNDEIGSKSGSMVSRRDKASVHPAIQAEVVPPAGSLLPKLPAPLNPAVDERELISLYGLTRSEAALAARLVAGKSIDSAAADLSISRHTARACLKRIVMKTGAGHLDLPLRDRTAVLQS